jgi:predicted nucleic acid-binding protein
MSEPERLLCDTSFVGHIGKRRAQPERYQHWDQGVVGRIEAAVLEISVMSLAEARFGYRKARWGQPRIQAEEARLAGFVQIPLDALVLDEWARLRLLREQKGWAISDNDLWIAATASTRGHALVTCDRGQARLGADPGLEVILLPANDESRA